MLFNHLNFITEEMAQLHNDCFGDLILASPSSIGFVHPDMVRISLLAKPISVLKNTYKNITFYPDLITPEDLVSYYMQPLKSVCGAVCQASTRSLAISPSGDILLGQRCFNKSLGNIRRNDIQDVLRNSPWLKLFRRALSDAGGYFPACTRCCGGFNAGLRSKEFSWTGGGANGNS